MVYDLLFAQVTVDTCGYSSILLLSQECAERANYKQESRERCSQHLDPTCQPGDATSAVPPSMFIQRADSRMCCSKENTCFLVVAGSSILQKSLYSSSIGMMELPQVCQVFSELTTIHAGKTPSHACMSRLNSAPKTA